MSTSLFGIKISKELSIFSQFFKIFLVCDHTTFKMAYHMTCEEVLADVWRESDEEYSSFDNSESYEGEEDDNNVYGYPNDRSGRLFGEISSDVETDAITQNVNNNQDLNYGDQMRNNVAPNIVFVDKQDVANVRQAIVDNEDYESEVESDESVEVQPRACKRPRRTVKQKTQQRRKSTRSICLGTRNCPCSCLGR